MNGNHERSTELGTVRISATQRARGTYGGPPRGSFNYGAAREHHLRLEERRAERARLTLQLHDTLFQGFLGASMLLHDAAEQVPTNSVIKSKMDRALQLVHLALDEGRAVLRGLQLARTASTSLEQALSELSDDFASAGHPRARVFACGRPRVLNPAIREQIYLIAREALLNAVRHSDATSVEVEVEYLPSKLRVIVRDNGKGFNHHHLLQSQGMGASHWGLRSMQERAGQIGGRLRIWSRPGAGTEVEITMDGELLFQAAACLPEFRNLQQEAVA